MNTQARLAAISKYRSPAYSGRGRALVVFDLHVKIADIGPQRLVINYDLPRSVEGYAQRVGSAVNANVQGRAGVVVNLIQANGGDVEMLRSIECAYKFKCSEVRPTDRSGALHCPAKVHLPAPRRFLSTFARPSRRQSCPSIFTCAVISVPSSSRVSLALRSTPSPP